MTSDSDRLITADDVGIPRRPRFTPSELAPYLCTSTRTVRRMMRDGRLRAAGDAVPYVEIAHYILRDQVAARRFLALRRRSAHGGASR